MSYQCAFNIVQIGNKQWRYYDFGPKAVPPLICIPGIAGTADVYYKQIKSLSMKVTQEKYFHLFLFSMTAENCPLEKLFSY